MNNSDEIGCLTKNMIVAKNICFVVDKCKLFDYHLRQHDRSKYDIDKNTGMIRFHTM